ncbi:DNA polymerase ligase N-terminal domain-containing protein [Saccharopolyspora griseoalba]|uniref:DNA polymerase ligase N-terminal domain-containing protein n=1 Tax=Saccharopolyspora griseoalba TaxID=1431848 RepID=A0ABW2LS31_9PSEU
MQDELREYLRKRDFATSGEPRGAAGSGSAAGREARFVVQMHDASTLHFDFRIEVGGVLKSWSIPKGPSVAPEVKRLAVPTEDHPVEYADFEGVIPEGEYGAGTVLVWDTGRYRHLSTDDLSAHEALERGRISIWLEGSKLRGGYALVRMGKSSGDWLLIKMRDEGADRRRKPTKTQPRSALSGSSLRELAAHGPEWR